MTDTIHTSAAPTHETPSPSIGAAIAIWANGIRNCARAASDLLTALYKELRPTTGELIFTGACEFTCAHCIYPQDYGRWHQTLPVNRWYRALKAVIEDLGITTFVYGGRAVTAPGVEMLTQLRSAHPGLRIGLIDNGISIIGHLDAVSRISPDWIDISIDGVRDAHDTQRKRLGSFDAALAGIRRLAKEAVTSKISVLTCVTRLNAHTLADMVQALSREGIRNFFFTSVSIVSGRRPDPSLRLSDEELAEVVKRVTDMASRTGDIYIEFGVFEAETWRAMGHAGLTRRATLADDHVVGALEAGAADVFLRYWPASLAGLRELIINPDGLVILPLSMAHARVPPERIFGDLSRERPRDIWSRMTTKAAFGHYINELNHERRILSGLEETTNTFTEGEANRHGLRELRIPRTRETDGNKADERLVECPSNRCIADVIPGRALTAHG